MAVLLDTGPLVAFLPRCDRCLSRVGAWPVWPNPAAAADLRVRHFRGMLSAASPARGSPERAESRCARV